MMGINGMMLLNMEKFLRRLVSLGFLNPNNALTVIAKVALPTDLHAPCH